MYLFEKSRTIGGLTEVCGCLVFQFITERQNMSGSGVVDREKNNNNNISQNGEFIMDFCR